MIGIPYARQDVQAGRLVDVCPLCGQACDNERREYGEHFVKAHVSQEGERVRLKATAECPTEEYAEVLEVYDDLLLCVQVEPRYRDEDDDGLRECPIDQVERLEALTDDQIITGAMRAANAELDRRVRQVAFRHPDQRARDR